jgi:uncharacterized protein (TIGR00730 family)
MKGGLRTVCVYSGSSDKIGPGYLRSAQAMGVALAERGLNVVFGGSRTGLMGALADAALAGGAHVIGVLPREFNTRALAHAGLSELRLVDTMHERKALMASLADAFIALPGGFGTLEELFEILTWAQLGHHRHPVGLLNVAGYYDLLLAMVERAAAEGFVYEEHRELLLTSADPATLIDRLENYEPPAGLERWMQRREEEA